jgi:uncharacterized protein
VKILTEKKYLSETWFHPSLEVRPSSFHGKGLFTKTLIRTGEAVMIWGGTLYTTQDLKDIREGKLKVAPFSYSFIEDDLLMAAPEDGMDYYVNHSCDPNVWMGDNLSVIARRDIQPDEEIRGDYAVWESEVDYVLEPCACGTEACRKKITGNDWMLPELQARYQGHFLPYISQKIARL